MEEIKVGLKKYTVIESLDDGSFIAERGKKKYLIRDLHGNSKEFYHIIDSYKKFLNTGIKHPKVCAKDKKNNVVVTDYIEGDTILNLLRKEDLKEIIYEKIFLLAYMARVERKALNFDPENFKFDGKEIYYMNEELYDFNDETKFVNKGIRLWFYTKEFAELLKEKGLEVDKSRIKPDYETNKQIVLMTCKYYH